jgi:hypothetical protein
MGKRRRRGIEAESVVTVDGDCDMSCEALGDDQIEFWFGPMIDGLHLYFDKSGFAKFMRVVEEMTTRVAKIPRGEEIEVMVSADERSRRAHMPNC